MMKRLSFTFLLAYGLLFVGQTQTQAQDQGDKEKFTFPAEWEKHEAVWITWAKDSYWNGDATDKLVLEIIQALRPYVKVKVVVNNSEEREEAIGKLGQHNDQNTEFVIIPDNDRWLRDMGPIFLRGDQGSTKLADFHYNFYGELPLNDPFCVKVDRVHREMASQMKIGLLSTDLVSEGGDREVNGKGTMICCESVELQRNPTLSKVEVEKELLRVMGQKKLVWVKQGPREDDKCTRGPIEGGIYTPTITGGHVDEFCRFVGENTILLAEVSAEERDNDPNSAISHQRLEETCGHLGKSTDQDGKPFRIVRIPAPDHIYNSYTLSDKMDSFDLNYFKGTVPGQKIQYNIASSYLNFIISNGVIVMPSYWKEGRPLSMKEKDEKAKGVLQGLFPDRKIIQINPESINNGGGGMHCITQHEPAKY